MKNQFIRSIFLLSMFVISSNVFAIDGSGVYGGGPFYKNGSTVVNELRQSGFKWVCVWTIHMESNGDLGYNGEFDLVKNGSYVGNSSYPNFPSDLQRLKQAPTTIEWIEAGLSGWGSGTFDNIKTFVNNEGTGPNSTLYRNFKALKEALPAIDAISFDDESTYDVSTATKFAVMLADIGFKVSICPYTRVSFWQNLVSNVNSQRPGTIEDVHVQCYAGGSGNNPCTWNGYFASNINVMPGVLDGNNIGSRMAGWNNECGITGGWLWLYDDFYGNLNTVQRYASAINNNITKEAENPPGQASNPTPSNSATGISTSVTLSWAAGNDASTHDVYFGTSNPPAFQQNQSGTSFNPGALSPNTTYYWKVDEVNKVGTTSGSVWSFRTSASATIDHTDPAGTGTITARTEIHSGEAATMAFDNLYTNGTQNRDWSKWLDNGGTPSTSAPSWIQIALPNSVVVNELAITSANDVNGRDPQSFNLQGSNNGASWSTLGSWSNQNWSSRFQRKTFSMSNSSAYRYYRLNITKNRSNYTMTQLCEIELIGPNSKKSAIAKINDGVENISIYPNPVQDILNVNGLSKNTPIRVYSVSGEVINVSNTEGKVDLSDLKTGMYFLEIDNKQRIKFIKK